MEINLKHIIKGHVNEVLGKEEQLYNYRIGICNQCPLMESGAFGQICSNRKYFNQETNKVSQIPCKNCISGCGCRLDAKGRLKEAKCPMNKWKM